MSDCCTMKPQATETEPGHCQCHYRPNVDIYERDDEIVILADLPGASPDSIEVNYEDGALLIGAKVEPRQAPETQHVRREYGTGEYRRSFRVSEVVDAERIAAAYSGGVLTLHLPKVQAAKPRKIAVSSN